MPKSTKSIYQIKITLKDIRPPVWRRLLVPSAMTLAEFHYVIQEAMGWMGGHLHMFMKGRQIFEPANPGDPLGLGIDIGDFGQEGEDEAEYTLAEMLPRLKSKLRYVYDFGDDWNHEILLEDRLEPEPGKSYPVCIKGRRACPPEDCGGPWGYADLLEALKNPDHPEHEDMLEWVDGEFNPEAFDLDETNAALAQLRLYK